MQKFVEQLIKDTAKKYDISEDALRLLFDSQFRFVREQIKNCDENYNYPVVLLPKFGKFAPSPNKLLRYKKIDIRSRFPLLYPQRLQKSPIGPDPAKNNNNSNNSDKDE